MGCFKAGIEVRSFGKTDASHEEVIQYEATMKNCTIVKVAGLSKALRMDLDDVLVRAEDKYHMTHSIYEFHGVSMGDR